MPKPRTCPHCSAVLGYDSGYAFNEAGDLVCGKCKQVVFPVRLASELDVETAVKKKQPASTTGGAGTSPYHGVACAYGPNYQRPHATGKLLDQGRHWTNGMYE